MLLGNWHETRPKVIVKSKIKKKYIVKSVFPNELETLPWAGHLGIRLIEKIIPILLRSESTLIFLNTRGQAEIWYQKLLEHSPDFAGVVALHHGSMSRETRHWVEDALYDGRLKVVICTSSLDLGVDFRPVETIIQVGGPKGVSRFMQRAGRSGHQPGATSNIYFLPTHSLELIEAAALREAVDKELTESRLPFIRSFDVLIQYLVTLAVSDGFLPQEIFEEVRNTFCYNSISEEEWLWCLSFIVQGGNSLQGYDEFHKVVIEEGVYKVTSRKVAMRHRLSMGTIVSDAMLKVKMQRGGYLGNIEEYFVAKLNPGDNFWFSGVLKDTSFGNSLVGYTINSVYSSSSGSDNYTDTITDSTYLFRIETYGINDSTNNVLHNQIYIKNASNVIIDSFVFPVSIWVANDTATYDYSF